MKNYIVETKNLKKSFKTYEAVKGIDLKVEEGTVYGFLGPNGAGKSTTIRMLLGLIKPTEGEVRVLGKDIRSNREEILRDVGALVESPSYYGHLTAYENLDITRNILKVDKSEIEKVLDFVKLSDVSNKKVKEFSLGMKQRLGIANALIGNPKLIILDEPTNGLDPSGIQEVRELIKTLPKEKGITVIVSSHILSEIELMADKVGIIQNGNLIYEGTIEELKKGSSEKIILETLQNDKVIEFLRNKGYKANINTEKIEILTNSISPSKVCKEVVFAGYEINYLAKEKKSLEDVFLTLTMEGEKC